MSAEKQLRCCERQRQRQRTVLLAGVVVGRRVVKDLECWQNGGNGISGGSWLWGQQQQQNDGYNCDPVTTAVSLITSLLFLDDFIYFSGYASGSLCFLPRHLPSLVAPYLPNNVMQ